MKEEVAMARKFEVFDRFGNPVDDDIVPDGGRVRVSMMARDGLSPLQRAIAEDKAARVAFDDSAARHQLGPVVLTDQAGRDRKAEAYRQMCDELVNGWRRPSAEPAVTAASNLWKTNNMNDREVARLHDTGDPVRDAYLDYVADLTSAWQRGR